MGSSMRWNYLIESDRGLRARQREGDFEDWESLVRYQRRSGDDSNWPDNSAELLKQSILDNTKPKFTTLSHANWRYSTEQYKVQGIVHEYKGWLFSINQQLSNTLDIECFYGGLHDKVWTNPRAPGDKLTYSIGKVAQIQATVTFNRFGTLGNSLRITVVAPTVRRSRGGPPLEANCFYRRDDFLNIETGTDLLDLMIACTKKHLRGLLRQHHGIEDSLVEDSETLTEADQRFRSLLRSVGTQSLKKQRGHSSYGMLPRGTAGGMTKWEYLLEGR